MVRSSTITTSEQNSKLTRVEPVFGWLEEHGGPTWPQRLVELADGLAITIEPGQLLELDYERERHFPASPQRLAWMIRNADRLTPRDGRRWREYRHRVIDNPRRDEALDRLDREETKGIDRLLILEGRTAADCLIECRHAVIWIEGKRNDWLDYSTTWDVTRDQLARNAEAAWLYARQLGKDSCLIICHEQPLKHHEELLVDGYRRGTWTGGWPHLSGDEREALGSGIGTLRWQAVVAEWPALGPLLS